MASLEKRVEDLERIALSFPGVEKGYAVHAGRELRVFVKPEQITEEQEVARAEQAKKDAEVARRKRIIRDAIQSKLIWLFVLIIIAMEAAGMLWTIQLQMQRNGHSWLDWLS